MNFLNEFCRTRFTNVLNIIFNLYRDMLHIIWDSHTLNEFCCSLTFRSRPWSCTRCASTFSFLLNFKLQLFSADLTSGLYCSSTLHDKFYTSFIHFLEKIQTEQIGFHCFRDCSYWPTPSLGMTILRFPQKWHLRFEKSIWVRN